MTDENFDFLEGVAPEDLLFPIGNEPLKKERVPAYRGRQHRELTEVLVSQLRSAGKNLTYYDTLSPGLVLKTKAHGAQSYQFNRGGRGRTSKLGCTRSMTLSAARARANRLSHATADLHQYDDSLGFEGASGPRKVPLAPEGLNPNRKLSDLFELYAERGMGHLSHSWRDQLVSLFHREILPTVGDHRVVLTNTETLSRYFEAVGYQHSEHHATRHRKALSAMFGWAAKANLIEVNPVRGTPGFHSGPPRAALPVDDLAAAYRNSSLLPRHWASIVKLHILLGLPLSTLRGLDIDQVDLVGAELVISPCCRRMLPLCDAAVTELKNAIGQRELGPVFPADGKSSECLGPDSRALSGFKRHLLRVEGVSFDPRRIRLSIIEALGVTGENPTVIKEGLQGRLTTFLTPQSRALHPVLIWNMKLLAEVYPEIPHNITNTERGLDAADL